MLVTPALIELNSYEKKLHTIINTYICATYSLEASYLILSASLQILDLC